MTTSIEISLDQQLLELAQKFVFQNKIDMNKLFEKFLKQLLIDNSEKIELQQALNWFAEPQAQIAIDEQQLIDIVKQTRLEIYEMEQAN